MTEKRYGLIGSWKGQRVVDFETGRNGLGLDDMVEVMNKQDKEIKDLKDELFDTASTLIYERSLNIQEDINKLKKEIYGDDDD